MSIRGRVDVYCTESDWEFIAVASSTELDDAGRPVVVRIVEFQATEPLYKATRIADFGDFDIRATELHDEIVTLAEMQERWGLIPADERWWPRYTGGLPVHMRGDLLYAVLGPLTTVELIDALKQVTQDSAQSLPRINQVLTELEFCDGSRPNMLLALAGALSATKQRFGSPAVADREDADHSRNRFDSEVLKHLGSFFLGAIDQFGFDEKSFSDWYKSTEAIFTFENGNWPPPEGGYTMTRPDLGRQSDIDLPELFAVTHEDFPTSAGGLNGKFDPWTVLSQLEVQLEDASDQDGSTHPRAKIDVRAWARLTAATVQFWHHWLSGGTFHPYSPYDDGEFTFQLLCSLVEIPQDSWESLTESRRICFAADLGEMLMILCRFPSSLVAEQAADALAHTCNGSRDLLNMARIAGLNLPYDTDRERFLSAIDRIAARMS